MAGGGGEEDLDVLIVSRWSARLQSQIPGNRRGNCAACGRLVVISPQGLELLRDKPNTVVKCVHCAVRDHPQERAVAAPGATEAARRALGLSPAQAAKLERQMTEIPLAEHDPDALEDR
jgi:hypothetical protein